jgi:DNA-3-methyladenine glycosylase I
MSRRQTELKRCPWPGSNPLYIAYHDEEWGVPERNDRALYEKLVLDGFQAGLSWITILRKRENFRRAFDDFAPEKVARYTDKKIAALLQDEGIIRNRAKMEGAVVSARAWLDLMEKGPGFSHLLWDFVEGKPIINRFKTIREVPAETPLSRNISKELKGRGFKFCGPTISYAFMQAIGMVDDHLVTCYRHAECAALGRS